MILFGWGHRRATNYGPVKSHYCDNCRNDVSLELSKISVWFTLFFIPVFPYENYRVLVCPICSCGVEISKEEFEQYKEAINNGYDPTLEGQGSSYSKGKTETQLNFLKEMEAYHREKTKENENPSNEISTNN